jgi:outer membrane protein
MILRIIIVCLFFSTSVLAQEKWDLEKCITYARENNLQVKKSNLNIEYRKNQHKQSKDNLYPSLSSSVGENFSFGRSLDQQANSYRNTSFNSTNFSLGTSVNLFNGFRDVNNIKKAELELKASEYDTRKLMNDISISITTSYLQILFQYELVKVAENQLAITQGQIKETKMKVEAGAKPAGDLLQLVAQESRERNSLVNANNSLRLRNLELKQLLDFQDSEELKIVVPDINMISVDMIIPPYQEVYKYAVENMPEIMSSRMRLESAKKSLDIAKAGHHPTLSMNAGFSTAYSSGRDLSFGDQIKENSKSVSLSLNIPIFSKFSVSNQIDNSKIQIADNEYSLNIAKLNLYKQIQKAYLDATSALEAYKSSNESVKSTKESFRYVSEKYNLGVVNTVEYNQSKNNLLKVESELLQAKYELIFKLKILDFYYGKNLKI